MGYPPDEQKIAMRVRRDAEAMGLTATKSRVRKEFALGFGQWQVNEGRKAIFTGDLHATAAFIAQLSAERVAG